MKNYLTLLIALWLCLPLSAQTFEGDYRVVAWPQSLQERLDSVLTSDLLQTSQIGLMVYDLTTDAPLYMLNHRQTLRPASTMKLLTAITAIDRLGGDYLLRTSLYYDGSIANGTLRGNLYCVGGMDPLFDRTDLTAFVNQLRQMGVKAVNGRILADVSFKDNDRLGEGWCWDDDNPVLTPLLYDRGDNFTEALARELRRAGVVINEPLSAQSSPARHQRTLIGSRSHTLAEVLVPMMKESDNLFAESVFYQIDAGTGGRPATGRQAASKVRQMIQKVGLRPGDYKVADGSGLSLYNYVSAELEVLLLRYAWFNRGVYATLMPSLPVAGTDGTLKNRMTKGPAAGNVYAKTGTLTGISSLAGYCVAPNGHALAFCIINQGLLNAADGRSLQDAVCQALCM